MGGDADGHRGQAGGGQRRDRRPCCLGQDECQRPRPAGGRHGRGALVERRHGAGAGEIGYMHDQWIVGRPPFGGIDARHRRVAGRGRPQAVDGLGRESDEAARRRSRAASAMAAASGARICARAQPCRRTSPASAAAATKASFTASPRRKGSTANCTFSFSFPVTEGQDRYVVSVGRRGEFSYTFEQLRGPRRSDTPRSMTSTASAVMSLRRNVLRGWRQQRRRSQRATGDGRR